MKLPKEYNKPLRQWARNVEEGDYILGIAGVLLSSFIALPFTVKIVLTMMKDCWISIWIGSIWLALVILATISAVFASVARNGMKNAEKIVEEYDCEIATVQDVLYSGSSTNHYQFIFNLKDKKDVKAFADIVDWDDITVHQKVGKEEFYVIHIGRHYYAIKRSADPSSYRLFGLGDNTFS